MSIEYTTAQMERGFHLIPAHMHGAVKRYVLNGIGMGSFGTAIFANDFLGAADAADEDNLAALGGWAKFLYNYVPNGCKGSRGAVGEWIKSGGIAGMYGEEAA